MCRIPGGATPPEVVRERIEKHILPALQETPPHAAVNSSYSRARLETSQSNCRDPGPYRSQDRTSLENDGKVVTFPAPHLVSA